ncbi:MAG: PIN domain-containing protein [Halobacteriota archaeon]|nr:PIN domain-containing protein [Halobacteriota archaeon]
MVDSSAWIEYFKGSESGLYVKTVLEDAFETIIVSAINIGEVYSWVLEYYDIDVAEDMRKMMKRRAFVCDVNETIVIEAAMLKNSNGWELDSSIIYVTAKKEGASILTGDSSFKNLKNATLIF